MSLERHVSACVLANGDYRHDERLLDIVQRGDLLIAADGGANWLARHGLVPDVLVGDMDSVSREVRRSVEQRGGRLVTAQREKDETDLELALLEAVALGSETITILGVFGGRVDHAIANICLLAMPALRGKDVRLYDGMTFVWLMDGVTEIRGQPGDLVSLIPFGQDVHGVRTLGLRYALHGETLLFGAARGVSNVLTECVATVEVGLGRLLVTHTPRVVRD
ncbi:MAG: thiamine diphosphokinase [Anaerolineae bacterium]|nr:thiamine diphosphokinase [Anaerolineae bacterium]